MLPSTRHYTPNAGNPGKEHTMTTATATARTIDNLRRNAYDTRGGFITQDDLPAIVAANRLEPLLVRWSTGRATVPAQGVADLIEILDNAGGIVYIRDVSFPTAD